MQDYNQGYSIVQTNTAIQSSIEQLQFIEDQSDIDNSLNMELEAGCQIARMLGYNIDGEKYPCAWGHITSAGSTAKYDSLWNARAINCYPLALKAAAKKLQLEFLKHYLYNKRLTLCTSWECQNHTVDQVLQLHKSIYQQLVEQSDKSLINLYFNLVSNLRIEHLGMASFYAEHWDAKQPVILVPSSSSDSWEKALKLLGFGSKQLIKIDVNEQMQVDINALQRVLQNAELKKIPILAVIAVLGTSKFGSIDAINQVSTLREEYEKKGLTFYFHIDASWGGYLASLFYDEQYQLLAYQEIKKQFKSFPSESVYQAYTAINKADSVTVDPYKMGYLPFGTSAFICKNREIAYLTKGDIFTKAPECQSHQIDHLKAYILDGTKPGAIAVACCLAQRKLPLNNAHFGQFIGKSIQACEYFIEGINQLSSTLTDYVNIHIPLNPESNIICISINPVNNSNLKVMNNFTDSLYALLKPTLDDLSKTFCTKVSIFHQDLGHVDSKQFVRKLGLDEQGFVYSIEDKSTQDNHLMILRHTLLTPSLIGHSDYQSFINIYLKMLWNCIVELSRKE